MFQVDKKQKSNTLIYVLLYFFVKILQLYLSRDFQFSYKHQLLS